MNKSRYSREGTQICPAKPNEFLAHFCDYAKESNQYFWPDAAVAQRMITLLPVDIRAALLKLKKTQWKSIHYRGRTDVRLKNCYKSKDIF